MDFTLEDIPDDEIARRRAVFEPLVASVRDLVDADIPARGGGGREGGAHQFFFFF